jgi:hypothetical protein
MHVIIAIALIVIAAAYLPAALPVLRDVLRYALGFLMAAACWVATGVAVLAIIYL